MIYLPPTLIADRPHNYQAVHVSVHVTDPPEMLPCRNYSNDSRVNLPDLHLQSTAAHGGNHNIPLVGRRFCAPPLNARGIS